MMRLILTLAVAVGASAMAYANDDEQPDLDSLKWVARPIVIFADAPQDPRLLHQMAESEGDMQELLARDVEIIVDAAPDQATALRRRFHPSDFNVILIDKDGTVIYRKPDPVTLSEIIRLIDRTPIRRQELEAQRNITN